MTMPGDEQLLPARDPGSGQEQQFTGGSEEETDEIPNPSTGVGIGAGEPSTFEPEEDEGAS